MRKMMLLLDFLFAKWSLDISRDLSTQCLYFKLLTTMSSLRQILIQFHYLCDYTCQSQNLSQFLFGPRPRIVWSLCKLLEKIHENN